MVSHRTDEAQVPARLHVAELHGWDADGIGHCGTIVRHQNALACFIEEDVVHIIEIRLMDLCPGGSVILRENETFATADPDTSSVIHAERTHQRNAGRSGDLVPVGTTVRGEGERLETTNDDTVPLDGDVPPFLALERLYCLPAITSGLGDNDIVAPSGIDGVSRRGERVDGAVQMLGWRGNLTSHSLWRGRAFTPRTGHGGNDNGINDT